MEKHFQPKGAAYIQQLITAAVTDGTRCVTVTGNYEIEQTVLLPSDFTLILENCHLRMADNTFCNMFRNEKSQDPHSRTADDKDHDICIEGRGQAILDGGLCNNLNERNSLKEGRPHISVNNILLFFHVDGFCIKNLHIRNQRWWAMNFLFCCHGKIQDIDFCSNDIWIHDDGTLHHGFTGPDFTYEKIQIRNSDGIDLRSGCHDLLIENITGFTQDDTVALTALCGTLEDMYHVEGADPDIYNVIIRNVHSAALCSNVRLLNQGALKLYNVLIDGVMDASKNSKHMDRGSIGVRIGDADHLYGSRPSTPEETFNITVRNVYSRAHRVIHLGGAMKNVTLENINGFDGYSVLIDNKAQMM